MYIKDVGSSSGTFLNGIRLCDANLESAKFEVRSGDYLQLGKDYADPKNKGPKPSVIPSKKKK